jgi:hypothetical protein
MVRETQNKRPRAERVQLGEEHSASCEQHPGASDSAKGRAGAAGESFIPCSFHHGTVKEPATGNTFPQSRWMFHLGGIASTLSMLSWALQFPLLYSFPCLYLPPLPRTPSSLRLSLNSWDRKDRNEGRWRKLCLSLPLGNWIRQRKGYVASGGKRISTLHVCGWFVTSVMESGSLLLHVLLALESVTSE